MVPKGNWLRPEKAEPALTRIEFAGWGIRAPGRHWSVSITHRFLRRGKDPISSLRKAQTPPSSSSRNFISFPGSGSKRTKE